MKIENFLLTFKLNADIFRGKQFNKGDDDLLNIGDECRDKQAAAQSKFLSSQAVISDGAKRKTNTQRTKIKYLPHGVCSSHRKTEVSNMRNVYETKNNQ